MAAAHDGLGAHVSATPRTSQPHPAPRVYPSVLRGVPSTRVHQVGSTEITYSRLHGGGVYLVAVMDGCSRYVGSWALSITLDVGFCREALEQALGVAQPEIFHCDPGAQFTSIDCTGRWESAGFRMSMGGRGRVLTGGDPAVRTVLGAIQS